MRHPPRSSSARIYPRALSISKRPIQPSTATQPTSQPANLPPQRHWFALGQYRGSYKWLNRTLKWVFTNIFNSKPTIEWDNYYIARLISYLLALLLYFVCWPSSTHLFLQLIKAQRASSQEIIFGICASVPLSLVHQSLKFFQLYLANIYTGLSWTRRGNLRSLVKEALLGLDSTCALPPSVL